MPDDIFPRLEAWPLAQLKPADYNPRNISAEALGRLTKSMAELGNLQPITVNARSGNVVGGHQRLKCLLALGHKETPVWLVDLDPMKEKAANLALNNLAGTFDGEALASVLEELSGTDLLGVTGFDPGELDKMLSTEPTEIEIKQIPTLPPPSMAWVLIGTPITKFGKIQALLDSLTDSETIIKTTVNDADGN